MFKFEVDQISYIDGLTKEVVSTHIPIRYVELPNNLSDEEIIKYYKEAVKKEAKVHDFNVKATNNYCLLIDKIKNSLHIDKDDMGDIDLEIYLYKMGLDYEAIKRVAYEATVDDIEPEINQLFK